MVGLNELGIGVDARVMGLAKDCAMRRRLLDLGFTQGARTVCLFASACGDPRAYEVRGAVIALRAKDARAILVEEVTP